MAAMIVGAIDQDAAHAHLAHLAEGDLDRLSITHISSRSDFGAEFDIGESGESAPDDNISGWRIGGPGQVATQS
ncbi:hypothetical protein Q2941_29190, partial [Bradyrhizobium sp. UFLA05-153]